MWEESRETVDGESGRRGRGGETDSGSPGTYEPYPLKLISRLELNSTVKDGEREKFG